jgi:SAM-dependent methyltransferase
MEALMGFDSYWPVRPPDLGENQWVEFLLGRREIRGFIAPPLPDEAVQSQFVGSCGPEAFVEARVFCSKLRVTARRHADKIRPRSKVLDFGVGWGRLYRMMLNYVVPENLVGVDIDKMCIDLCRKAMPYGTFAQNGIRPPLAFPGGSFDLIYAYSVFSHLAPETGGDWFRDFRRVLKPGGLFAFTTLKAAHLEVWHSLALSGKSIGHTKGFERAGFEYDAWRERLDAGAPLYLPVGGGDCRDASFYGETILSLPAVKTLAGESGLEVRRFEEGDDLPQAFVVLQRPRVSSRGA